jgi:hypothetical protein
MDLERLIVEIEDLLFPRFQLNVWERVLYYHLLRHTRLIGIESGQAESSAGLKVIELSFAIDWLLILVVGVLGQLAGAMNALGWTTVVLAAIWVVVFGYFRFMKA